MQEIKKGDKLLMKVIIRGVVRDQDISYAYERNGHLCVLWNGSVNTIAEMEGTTFTVLDKVKDKEIIERGLDYRRFDNNGKFTEELNRQFSQRPVPNYKDYLIVR